MKKRFIALLTAIMTTFCLIHAQADELYSTPNLDETAELLASDANDAGINVSISGTKQSGIAEFAVTFENAGEHDAELYVFTAVYNADGTINSVKKYTVASEAGSSFVKNYSTVFGDGEAAVYVWDTALRPLAVRFSSKDCTGPEASVSGKISIGSEDVWASAEPESANPAANAVDGELSTVWTSETSKESPEYLTAYLGDTYEVTKVGAALDKSDEREYIFSVSLSYDGENFTDVVQNATDGDSNSIQYFEITPTLARYIRVMVSRLDNGWTRLSEIEVYGYEPSGGDILFEDDFSTLNEWTVSPMDETTYTDYEPSLGGKLYAEAAAMPEGGSGAMRLYDNVDRSGSTEGEALTITGVSASQTPETANVPENVLDGNTGTIWTAKNVTDSAPATLTAELDGIYYLTKVGIAFGTANEARSYVVSVSLSEDGKSYMTVASKISITQSAKSTITQYIKFSQTAAKYVRFTFYARTDSSNNGWIRVCGIEAVGTLDGIEGAGGILAQLHFSPPKDSSNNRADYEINFDMYMPSEIEGSSASNYYSGISLTDGVITGGADLNRYSAIQLRFENSNGKIRVNTITSDYFNEGSPIELFDGSFSRDTLWHVKMQISPLSRKAYITIDDGSTKETKLIYFAYSDDELTRNCMWSGYEANTLVFNTGAGAKCEMYVSNLSLKQTETAGGTDLSAAPVNGIIRLEATRLESDPTTNVFYGRYVYHNGADNMLAVESEINPALTRFVEREGLIGSGVSLEAVSLPGYFMVTENGGIYLKKLENNGVFYANATFIKTAEDNAGYYTGSTYSYKTYLNREKYIYDARSARYIQKGDLKPWSRYEDAGAVFYLRSEAAAYVSDNFYGDSISSQWWTNYPWNSNNPANDSNNFSALITAKNVIVENGELLLKATEIPYGSWPKNMSGETGISYNGSYGKVWERWKGYVGVVSIQNKVYNKQCYIEGSFKQPESPIGYWNAFWLNGRDSWPPEIDIFETLSSVYGPKAWHTALHYNDNNSSILGKQTSTIDITSGYHTFALDWGYDYMKFYIDGKCYTRVTPSNDTNKTALNYQKNLRLILNTGIGGWEAEPDSSMVWNDGLRCKYIRSFQY